MKPSAISSLIVALLHAASAVAATTYYVSPEGNDIHSGTTPETAWRTVARINRSAFTPGDRILFEGGKTFSGPVKLGPDDEGTAGLPIEIGTYPGEENAPATIAAGTGPGIDVWNVSGVRISNLRIAGGGADVNEASGIRFLSTLPGGASNVAVDRVEISGFGRHGISVGAWETEAGYRDVRLTNCITRDNLRTGILTWGPWGEGLYAHSKVYVGYCEAYGMKGGSGITLSSVNGGVVERSVAHDNGAEFSGAAGIWAWDANDILFQYNESYRNRTIGVDGDGFDFDGGVTNSVMQYNYSHDNDAAGFLLAQYPGAPQAMRNIVLRYNISENDCRKKDYGAIHVWNGDGAERIRNIQIYQNTVYLGSGSKSEPCAIGVVSPTTSVAIRNNLFVTAAGETLVSVVPDQVDILFQSNAYWSGRDFFRVVWNGDAYHSLAEWLQAAENQERLGSTILAMHADPLLANPGGGGTVRDVDNLTSLAAYKLKPESPLSGRGINLKDEFGIQPGKHGFFGGSVSHLLRPAIGADTAAAAVTVM